MQEKTWLIALALGIVLCGCQSYGIKKQRGYSDRWPTVRECEAACIDWDSKRERCLKFHRDTSEHCAELLADALENDDE